MYKHMEIEVDDRGLYVLAIAFIQQSDNTIEVKKRYNSIEIREDLKAFAHQNNVSVEELKDNHRLIKFKRHGMVVLPSQTYNYEIRALPVEKKRDPRSAKYYRDDFKREPLISRKVLAIASVGVIAIAGIASSINYAIRRDNAFNNQYIKPTYYSSDQISSQMIDVLNDYEEFDQIMKSLANGDYASLKDKSLVKFYRYLNFILSSNEKGIVEYRENYNKSEDPVYDINLSGYFPVDSIDNVALSSHERALDSLLYDLHQGSRQDQHSSIDYLKRRILNFVYNDDYEVSANSKGEAVYYNINHLSPIACYAILVRVRPIISMIDVSYKGYDKKQILEKIDSRIAYCLDMIRINITNSNNRTLG